MNRGLHKENRPELNKNQVLKLISSLSKFMIPSEFIAIARESVSVPDDRFFNDPSFKRFQEAWAAGYFALALRQVYNNLKVQLVSDYERFPDFILRINGHQYEFEFTIADKPERQIGKVYKNRKDNPLHGEPYQPERGRQEGPYWIANAIKRKIEKCYSTKPHLLVYANFEAHTLAPEDIAASCKDRTAPFNSIWVLWRFRYIKLSDNSNIFNEIDGQSWHDIPVDPWNQKLIK